MDFGRLGTALVRNRGALRGRAAARGRCEHRVVDRLRVAQQTVQAVYRRLVEASDGATDGSIAAEWLLDNYYIVERAFRLVRDEFPAEFERRLPRVPSGDLQGYPLVYAFAFELVTADQAHVDLDTLLHRVSDFQAARPFSIAEVWALPILLRLALLESLAHTVASLGLTAPPATQPNAHADDMSGGDDRASPPPDQVVATCIRSLRTLETADWQRFFEQISTTERVLRTDPAGVYGRMNFDTRDRYRKVVEELAAHSDHSEEEVASEAVRLAHESPADRRVHVGYYLVDAGVDVLAHVVRYHPLWKARGRRFLTRHPTATYLGGIAAVAVVHEVVLCDALRVLGAGPFLIAAAATVALVPVTTIGVALINALLTAVLPPRVLPKMDFSKGLPADCQTLVVIPAMLTDAEEGGATLQA